MAALYDVKGSIYDSFTKYIYPACKKYWAVFANQDVSTKCLDIKAAQLVKSIIYGSITVHHKSQDS